MIAVLPQTGPMPREPRFSALSRHFYEGLADGHLRTTRCSQCGRISFPPRGDCPDCWSDAWTWQDLSGQGVLYSRTRIAVVPQRFIDRAPLDLGVIDLEEGLRLICWLVDGAELLAPDAPVQVVALKFDNGCLLGARPE